METVIIRARRVLLLSRQTEKSYGLLIPSYAKETGEIVGGHGVYWFPKNLATLVPTGKKFFTEIEYIVTAPEWVFIKQKISAYELLTDL